MTLIFTISGKKESGKDTSANFILGHVLASNNIIRGKFKVNEQGKLWVSDLFGDTAHEGILDLNRQFSAETISFLNEEIYPHIKLYSCADELKTFCINVLGLSWESLNGSNEEKDAPTHILWDNMPTEIRGDKTGPMSGREIMQHFGTGIVRKLYGPAWAKATFKKIQRENPAIAVVKDCRFPDEITEGDAYNAISIRLTRNIHNDNHESETALDPENFDWTKFSYVLDNAKMDIPTQCQSLYHILEDLQLIG